MMHGKMVPMISYKSDSLELTLYREESWPAGCKRVFCSGYSRLGGAEQRGRSSHRRQDCIDWLTKAASAFDQSAQWLAVVAKELNR
jgi:hypothetical protein